MRATFENSVNVLIKAYFQGHLNAMECSCCAVGNLIANANGYEFDQYGGWVGRYPVWQKAIRFRRVITEYFAGDVKKEIESTGYTAHDINKIEAAFMDNASTYCHPERDNFNGLMAVVDVLADIHGISLEAKETAKQLFVKV